MDLYHKYQGYDENDPSPVNRPSNMRVVLITDNTVWSPSVMYAYQEHYHMGDWLFADILSGNENSYYGWGNVHEYGHMIDVNILSVPEFTNNMYSILGGMKRYEIAISNDPNSNFNPRYLHGAVDDGEKGFDLFLSNMIKNPDSDPTLVVGGWAKSNGFNRATTLYNLFRYFDDWDYSDYNFNNVYTREKAESVKKYGAFGSALRRLRIDRSRGRFLQGLGTRLPAVENFLSDMNYNSNIIVASDAVGYNLVKFMEERGFATATDEMRTYASKYPDVPVKLNYFNTTADMLNRRNKILHDRPEFDDVVASLELTNKDLDGNNLSGDVDLTLGVDKYSSSVIAYEVYRKDPATGAYKLIGFTRTNKYIDKGVPSGTKLSDYKVIAYDYRLNTSKNVVNLEIGDSEYDESRFYYNDNKDLVIPDSIPVSNNNETFTGWQLKGTENVYMPGDIVENSLLNDESVLVATWKINDPIEEPKVVVDPIISNSVGVTAPIVELKPIEIPKTTGNNGISSNPISSVPKSNSSTSKDSLGSRDSIGSKKSVIRIGGSDRISTSVMISKSRFKSSEYVILVNGWSHADALTASSLSGELKAPILLIEKNRVDKLVLDEINRLGAKNIILIGGKDTISLNIEDSFKSKNFGGVFDDLNFERIAGEDRYETAVKIAEKVFKLSGVRKGIIIASGQNFADSLSAGAYSSKSKMPILLVRKNSVPDSTASFVGSLEKNITKEIVGGYESVGDVVEKDINASSRMHGADRYETSLKIAEKVFSGSKKAYLVSGVNFADALVIGGIAGMDDSSILLVSNTGVNENIATFVKDKIENIIVVGGENTISNEIVKSLI